MSHGRVYGGGQPIPFQAAPSAGAAAAGSTSSGGHLNFGAISSASAGADSRADFSAVGSGPYAGFGSRPESSQWSLARAVGGALFFPIQAVASVAAPSAAAAVTPAAANGGTSAASAYDPHLANFPLLPRFRGTGGDLYPVPFGAQSPPPRGGLPSPGASIRAQEVTQSQNLSSLLNAPIFASDEVEPPPLYVSPLPAKYNEPVAAVRALIRQYATEANIAGEYHEYASNHRRGKHSTGPSTRDAGDVANGVVEGVGMPGSGTAVSEEVAAAQYAKCLSVVPARYFAADFSVAQEALMFYEAQLAAAAAEAEEEDAADAKRREGGGGGDSVAAHGSSADSSASSFYSTFSSPPARSRTGSVSSAAGNGGGGGSGNSTYFQAAWAATHAPTHRYSADAIGIVPGVVGAVLVTPAKAAASLYKLFTKVTGGTARSPRGGVVATSHQRSMPFMKKDDPDDAWEGGQGLVSASSAEDLNALQLQLRLQSYLDLVELTLMQLVGSKSQAFFASLETVQTLQDDAADALALASRIRADMRTLQTRLVGGGLLVSARERHLRNALRLRTTLDIVASIAKTQSTIKLLLATSEYGSAIHLVHSTLAIVRTPEYRRIKCLAQMETKLRENLKLIDMLMLAEFVAIALPDASSTMNETDASTTAPNVLPTRAALRASAALSDDDRERLVTLAHTLASFGTLLPALLKYAADLRQHAHEQAAAFWAEVVPPRPSPSPEHTRRASTITSSATAVTNGSSAASVRRSSSSSNIASNLATPVNSASAAAAAAAASSTSPTAASPASAAFTPSSASASFMSLIPSALKRTGSVVASVPVAPPVAPIAVPPPPPDEPAAASGSSSSPQTPDAALLDSTAQAFIASLPHAQFLALQARLHARLARIVYRAMSVRDAVLEAVAVVSPSSAAAGTGPAISPTRLRGEFRDLLQSLLARSASRSTSFAASADEDAGQGVIESRCVSLLEPRLTAHSRLTLREMKGVFDATMEFVREMEEVGQDASPSEAPDARPKFVCLELRKITLQHEKAFLATTHARLIATLATAMERDSWERVDVPRAFQTLLDDAFARRPRGITAASANGTADTDAAEESPRDGDDASPVTAATYLFIEQEAVPAGATPTFAKYPVASSVLTLLDLVSYYCECARQLKGVASDVLKSVVHLLTLFTSRSLQLILGAGAVQVNPAVKVITSKHLALTSQCLTLVATQVPQLRLQLQAHFPDKHHAVLAKDLARVTRDYEDHVREIFSKLEEMALEVCDATGKGCVQWIKREEEIATHAKMATTPTTAAGGATNAAAPPINDLPTMFKLSSRLLTQTEALYNVLAEFLQPSQRAQVMHRIAVGYSERFQRYFNSSASGCLVASSLVSSTTRTKLAKRVDATLDKFRPWLAPEDWTRMKQGLAVFAVAPPVTNAPTTSTATRAKQPKATSEAPPPPPPTATSVKEATAAAAAAATAESSCDVDAPARPLSASTPPPISPPDSTPAGSNGVDDDSELP